MSESWDPYIPFNLHFRPRRELGREEVSWTSPSLHKELVPRGVILIHPEDWEKLAGRADVSETWGSVEIRLNSAIPRGEILMNARDFQDAFTRRPTRTDFEFAQSTAYMLQMAEKLQALIERTE